MGNGSTRTGTSLTISGMTTVRSRSSLRHSLLSLSLYEGVLFISSIFERSYKLAIPASEHLADFFERSGDGNILFVIKSLRFPEDHDEDAESVELADAEADIGQLLLSAQKGGGRNGFYQLDEEHVDSLSERVALRFV